MAFYSSDDRITSAELLSAHRLSISGLICDHSLARRNEESYGKQISTYLLDLYRVGNNYMSNKSEGVWRRGSWGMPCKPPAPEPLTYTKKNPKPLSTFWPHMLTAYFQATDFCASRQNRDGYSTEMSFLSIAYANADVAGHLFPLDISISSAKRPI